MTVTDKVSDANAASQQVASDEIERLGIVLDEIEKNINVLLKRTESLAELRKAATDLAHAHKSFRHALMSVMTIQDRIIDGSISGKTKGNV